MHHTRNKSSHLPSNLLLPRVCFFFLSLSPRCCITSWWSRKCGTKTMFGRWQCICLKYKTKEGHGGTVGMATALRTWWGRGSSVDMPDMRWHTRRDTHMGNVCAQLDSVQNPARRRFYWHAYRYPHLHQYLFFFHPYPIRQTSIYTNRPWGGHKEQDRVDEVSLHSEGSIFDIL